MMNKVKLLLLLSVGLTCSLSGQAGPVKKVEDNGRLPAYRLINTPDNRAAFIKGSVPGLKKIPVQSFWFSNTIEEWQKGVHPAPRKQYVVTLKGTLRFKVSDGSTFMIAPGTVLLAEDTEGEGHSWEMVDGDEWIRAYIPVSGTDNGFIADK
ncbi:hypothetical protein [Serratia inhibens]|uniref:hypothetical protein n=1 Tax=Serratia inhibens TaxID=2338073 RepID=UPI00080990D0|nr:hypothetical protein Q5A_005765 [Serratia inhibens PRI-2C]